MRTLMSIDFEGGRLYTVIEITGDAGDALEKGDFEFVSRAVDGTIWWASRPDNPVLLEDMVEPGSDPEDIDESRVPQYGTGW